MENRSAKPGGIQLGGAIGLEVKAYYPIPKSAGKSEREEMASGKYKTSKGDIDNVVKAIADALNGLHTRTMRS